VRLFRKGRHRAQKQREPGAVRRLRADLEWSESDRARLSEENRVLRRQLAAPGSEEATQPIEIPITVPGAPSRIVAVQAAREPASAPRRLPAWALRDEEIV
jgi:hypothetical protein